MGYKKDDNLSFMEIEDKTSWDLLKSSIKKIHDDNRYVDEKIIVNRGYYSNNFIVENTVEYFSEKHNLSEFIGQNKCQNKYTDTVIEKYDLKILKKVSPDIILDLHGSTVDRAIKSVQRISLSNPNSWILIITGKGKKFLENVDFGPIRINVLYYIKNNPQLFSGYGSSKHIKGGEGVIYVKTRKGF